jgi:hypothetical protein
MRRSFPGEEVRGYESLAEATTCDRKDTHVLAAANDSPPRCPEVRGRDETPPVETQC